MFRLTKKQTPTAVGSEAPEGWRVMHVYIFLRCSLLACAAACSYSTLIGGESQIPSCPPAQGSTVGTQRNPVPSPREPGFKTTLRIERAAALSSRRPNHCYLLALSDYATPKADTPSDRPGARPARRGLPPAPRPALGCCPMPLPRWLQRSPPPPPVPR